MLAATADGSASYDGDKREHLPNIRLEELFQWRKKKGEVEHNGKSILVTAQLPVDRLGAKRDAKEPIIGTGILEETQVYAALRVITLREVALRKLDIATLGEFSHWRDWGENIRNPETIYIRVMRALTKENIQFTSMVERICFHPVRESDYAWMERCSASIRSAFSALSDVLQDVTQRLRADLDDEANMSFDQICEERYAAHLARVKLSK